MVTTFHLLTLPRYFCERILVERIFLYSCPVTLLEFNTYVRDVLIGHFTDDEMDTAVIISFLSFFSRKKNLQYPNFI